MRFSVIVPTCRRPEALAACLSRLAPGGQTLSAADYEVIVTDDGGDDTTETMVTERFPGVRWTRGPGRGPAANRNHGASVARGEWLVFTDDDCLPDAGWLAAFAVAAKADATVLEGRTRAPGPKTHPFDDCPVNEHGGNLWSCNFAIRAAVYAAAGGFDERFPYPAMEDVELHARLRERGVTVRFVPAALVVHPWKRIHRWREHRRRHLASRRLMEALHPGGGFPGTPWRAAWTAGRVLLTEHLPFLLRHPVEGARCLPPVAAALLAEVWLVRRKPVTPLPPAFPSS